MTTAVDTQDFREGVRANVATDSQCDAAYLWMNALATVIACYGLFENSPAVVIGAMLIAMLLGPISGIALGLVDGNDVLMRSAFMSLLAGVAVVYATDRKKRAVYQSSKAVQPCGIVDQDFLAHCGIWHPDRKLVHETTVIDRGKRSDFRAGPNRGGLRIGMRPVAAPENAVRVGRHQRPCEWRDVWIVGRLR
jgi:hypothetical protein